MIIGPFLPLLPLSHAFEQARVTRLVRCLFVGLLVVLRRFIAVGQSVIVRVVKQ